MKKTLLLSAILLSTVWISYGQWTYTNLSTSKKFMGITSSGSKAYFAGGHNGFNTISLVESYDVETGSWANIGDLSIARQVIAGTACGSELFFGGGANSSMNVVYSTVDIYDIASGQWSAQNLSAARFDISAVSKGNKVLFAGGCNYNIVCTDVVDIYDVSNGIWSTANLSSARAGMASSVVGDLAVFAGGFINGGGVSSRVDIYNFATDTWTTAELSEARVWASAVTVNDKVIIAGGIKSFPGVPSDRVDIFNSSNGTWTTDTLSEARAWISAGSINGKAYFAGGANIANGGVTYDFKNIVNIYDDADGAWTTDTLSQPRCSHGIAVGNHFLVAGGNSYNGLLSSVEIYTDLTLIHVPADYPTIQQAIDASNAGDTVLVAEKTYYENINFNGKAIIVASEFIMDGDANHISNTIIDGSQPVDPDIGSVVSFNSGEDTTSVLCGFTITRGTGTFVAVAGNARLGGGVIFGSGGKLLNNYIEYNNINNEGWASGGGIFAGGPMEPPLVVLRGNRISHNKSISSSDQGTGGGIEIWFNLVMADNELSFNEATGAFRGDGGGARISGSFFPIELSITHNSITNNKATSNSDITDIVISGGLDIFLNCSGIVSNNDISFNIAEIPGDKWCYGTGVLVESINSADFIFENNLITGNTFSGGNCMGGGLCIYDTGGKFWNNVVQNNVGTHGGGVAVSSNVNDTAILINNTITGNEGVYGGGFYASSAHAVVINTIIWGNSAPASPSIYEESSTLEVRYSDVEGNELWPGEGNIKDEPQFDADGYHLGDSCTLINQGISSITINDVMYECPPYDIDGDPRPYLPGTQPEIGVDEVLEVSVDEPFDTNSASLNVFPNPADQFITVNLKNSSVINEVNIYSNTGQIVFKGMPNDNRIDVSKLRPGIYIIELTIDQTKSREKLIVE